MKRRHALLVVATSLVVALLPMTASAEPPAWPDGAEITLGDITHEAVTVSWPAASHANGIDKYRVHIFLEGEEDPMVTDQVAPELLTHTLTGLNPETAYRVWVEAVSVPNPDEDPESSFLGEEAVPFLTTEAPKPPHLGPTAVGAMDPTTGIWYLRSQGGTVTTFYYGNPGDYPFMGDWNCDGVDTPGLYRQSDGYVYLRNTNTQGIADIRFFFGNPGDIPIVGDFNNDGCDTVSIYRPSETRFYIINELGADEGGLGAAEFSFIFGNPGDKPFVGDFNGNGQDTIGLHRESTGFVYFRNTLTTGIADNEFYFGNPGDRFVAGDWGIVDGVDTPGVFRPSNTTWYFRHTNTQGIGDSQFVWGEPQWVPVAGKFTK